MIKKYLKSLNTSKKIFVYMLITSLMSQIFTGILACASIMKVSNSIQTQSGEMEDSTTDNCEFILKNQGKKSLSDYAKQFSENCELTMNNFESQVDSLCFHTQNLYSINLNSPIKNNYQSVDAEKNTLGYIIDDSNSSKTTNDFMVYDFSGNLSNIFYKTTSESWSSLNNEQKSEIKNDKIIVSENVPSDELINEANIVSNLLHTAKLVCKSNENISNLYICTKTGIFQQVSENSEFELIDPRQTDWYKNTIASAKNEHGIWQKSLSYSDGNPQIIYSRAFRDSKNDVRGIIAVNLNVNKILRKAIENNDTENHKNIFALDNNTSNILNITDFKVDNTENSESYKNLIALMQNRESSISEILIDGSEYLVAYSPIPSLPISIGIAEKSDFAKSESQSIKNGLASEFENSKKASGSSTSTVLFHFFIIFCAFSLIMYAVCRTLSSKITPSIQKQTAKLKHLDNELDMAQKIQKSMLPKKISPEIARDDFEIYASNVPVEKIGGDFYDFFLLDKNNLVISIADTSDKGVPAALFMSAAKNALQIQLKSHKSLADAVEIVNDNLYENNEMRMFVTAFVGIINLNTGSMEFINAGHMPPLIYNSVSNKFDFLEVPHNCALGAIKNKKYLAGRAKIDKNDVILLYTDGVTETRGRNNELFSQDRLKELVNSLDTQKLSIKKLISHIQEEISKFSADPQSNDDITLMGFRNL